MGWGRHRDYAPRPRRPKANRLNQEELEKLARQMNAAVGRSPVLTGLGVQVRAERGRFYVARSAPTRSVVWGRITPVVEDGPLLLECERRTDQWYEVARGGVQKMIKTIAGDTRGTFHGLGYLDTALRQAQRAGRTPRVEPRGEDFVDGDSGKRCSAQEALFLYFGVPLAVLIQPRGWYIYHRTPFIVEYTPDRSRVLVCFCSSSFLGGNIVGTCLYVRHDPAPGSAEDDQESPVWAAYTIRPSASQDITTAEAWLHMRKWRSWS